MARHRALLIVVAAAALAGAMRAQERARPAVTAADYARAEKFLAPAVAGLVVGGSVIATWTEGDRFSYQTTLAGGSMQTILVDPVKKTRTVCTANCPPPAPANHGYGAASNYMMRRRWDYFGRWLMEVEPPTEYTIGAASR